MPGRTILAHKYKSNFPTKIGPFLGSKKNSFGNPTNDTTNVCIKMTNITNIWFVGLKRD